jgi:ribonuclease HII
MDFNFEKRLFERGFSSVCGIDEAGRGALAGPLVAAAVILEPKNVDCFSELNDSKLLNEEKREELFPIILAKARSCAIGVSHSWEINRQGLTYANVQSMRRACGFLRLRPDYVLCDYMSGARFDQPFELIAKGDRTVLSIAAASVIAKVVRDRIMKAFAKKFPKYGFEIHKGYGTAFHMEKVEAHGVCDIHRTVFEPLKPKLF